MLEDCSDLGSRTSSLLGVPGHTKMRTLQPEQATDYQATASFPGKDEQMRAVRLQLHDSGFIPEHKINDEVRWFYSDLGIDNSYLAHDTVENIVSYILSLYSAKVSTAAVPQEEWNLQFQRQCSDHAVFLDTTIPGTANAQGSHYEEIIDTRYLTPSDPKTKAWRLETFRCQDVLQVESNPKQLRFYFVGECHFPSKDVRSDESDLSKVSDKAFWDRASSHTKRLYQELIIKALDRTGPVTELYEVEGIEEARLVAAFHVHTAPGFYSAMSDLYHYYGLTTSRKYVEQFANGITVMSLYLKPAPTRPGSKFPPFRYAIYEVLRETSLLFSLPKSIYSHEMASGKLSLQEAVYAHCGSIFVSHFLNRLGPEYHALASVLDMTVSSNQELMNRLKQRLRGETFTRRYIEDLVRSHIEILKPLYLNFARSHYVSSNYDSDEFWSTDKVPGSDEIRRLIAKSSLLDEHAAVVFGAFLTFNEHVLKTNFYTPTKVALSFRLDPSFLPSEEYPQNPYGMFLVIGQEFRGFHIRFRDVARGGIRIVRSRNFETWSMNARSLFDENYNLASTQQRKNKDIPEGGSKGVILLNFEHQDKSEQAFRKYIDAIIDLLIPGQSPGIKEAIADLYGQEEILFMGPDENTAGLVNWATQHAKTRGAPWWKSFFTGKSPRTGGIPHDKYGMTSLSVREYVCGIYRRLGIENTPVRKFQTGGPDGDLGSNEILLSSPNELYVGIVDGSGVLADPNGLEKSELVRLAQKRATIADYDESKLSAEGYKVLVDDTDVRLPNGVLVENGTTFRNTYHLEAPSLQRIDMFVPCGGRPEAINQSNVAQLIDAQGHSRIPYIVEGANLFITQSAKLALENAGAIVYKDASANKGGVTSSSLEVLASLALDDAAFFEHMCVHADGTIPTFYQAYVSDVQARIRENARLEFEAIFRDHEATGRPRSVLSDDLSIAINTLSDELVASNLWYDVAFRDGILRIALPNVLVDKVGLDSILKAVPGSYLRAIFGSYLAGRYIYEHGTRANQFAFYDFMTKQRALVLEK